MSKATHRGVRNVTRTMDRLAALVRAEATRLQIPDRIAKDLEWRLDFVADHVEKKAGVTPKMKVAFDAEVIGEEVGGPLEQDGDEAYMGGEFSQQENRELSGLQEGGKLGPSPVDGPRSPTPGVQASFKGLVASLKRLDPKSPAAKRVAKALRLATKVAEDAENEEAPAAEGDEAPAEEKQGGKGKKASHGFNLTA